MATDSQAMYDQQRDLWQAIRRLTGTTLRTLGQRRSFDVIAVGDGAVTIRVQTGHGERVLRRSSFEGAYQELTRAGELFRDRIDATYAPRNSAYVAAILVAAGSKYSLRPLRLFK